MSRVPRQGRWREAAWLIKGEISPYVARRLGAVLLLVVFGALMNAVAPLALKWIIDGLRSHGRVPLGAMVLVGCYAGSQWLGRSSAELRMLRYAQAERRILRTLNQNLFVHVLRVPLRFHLDGQSGAVNQAIENGLDGVRLILHHLVFTLLPVCTELLLVGWILSRLHEPVFLVLFALASVSYAILFGVSAARIAESAREAAEARVASGAVMMDGLLNFETVKAFGAEGQVSDKARGALETSEQAWVRFYRRYAHNGLAVALVFALFLTGTMMFALRAVHAGALTVGGLVLVNTYMLQLVRPAEMLGFGVQGFAHGVAMLDGALDILAVAPETGVGLRLPNCARGMLEFEHVTLRYGPGRVALEDVSFTVPAGATLGVVGQSGSGKSSIVRLLLRLMEPDAGVIRIDGMAVSDLAPSVLRESIAVVPQDVMLFDDTIEYNIAVGRPQTTRGEVERAARLAQLESAIATMPEGYGTIVGERGLRLSGGERQRIALARAALRRALVYVFDEATAALDAGMERAVLAGVRALSAQATTVIIAHRLESVVHADRILVLHAGRVTESGTHEGLLRAGGAYAALWQAQHRGAAAA